MITGPAGAPFDQFLATRDSTLLNPQTLEHFLKLCTPFQETPESLLLLLISRQVPGYRGFHRALAESMEAENVPDEFASVADAVNLELAERGYALRESRYRSATPNFTGPVTIDGFLTFTPAQRTFLAKLASETSVTVTLPDWPGSADARQDLLHAGFRERRLELVRQSRRTVFSAASLDQELEEIVLRILAHHANGRQFHEMGIILGSREPYALALESTLARFGIPARIHFPRALSTHPAVQYIAGLIRAVLAGSDHADLLRLLRMPINGLGATPAGDHLDFALRDQLPSAGPLPELPSLDHLTRETLTPPNWAARLKTLRNLIPLCGITDLQLLRSISAALEAFGNALDIAALALDTTRLSLASFWPNVEIVLASETFQPADHRPNVVNVVDVRQSASWEFPIAFVPGLSERHFPKDRLLFDLSTTRATGEVTLSYSRFDDKGNPSLRSFFLDEEGEPAGSTRILPRPTPCPPPVIPSASPDLRARHATLNPTSIETFQQCPFQFFARRTLKLNPRPAKPRDRLDVLLQGSILHQALAEGSFDRVFEEQCRKKNIPAGYRTEAVRLELVRNFEAFMADRQWPLAWPALAEQTFAFPLTPDLAIKGRIDRLETGPDHQAIVIDYKYSPAIRIRDRPGVQGGLYLLAAERAFGLEPAGMFYCALREPIAWEGWHAVPGLKLGEATTPSVLRELIAEAEQQARETFDSIAAGDKQVRPADRTKCRYCDYNQICRIEVSACRLIASGSAASGSAASGSAASGSSE